MLSREQIIDAEREVSRDEKGVCATLHKMNEGTRLIDTNFQRILCLAHVIQLAIRDLLLNIKAELKNDYLQDGLNEKALAKSLHKVRPDTIVSAISKVRHLKGVLMVLMVLMVLDPRS